MILYQDLKSRQIHIVLPVILFGLSIAAYLQSFTGWKNLLLNIGFYILTMALMMTYISIREKKVVNPFINHFGLGDFLFFIAICPLFYLHNYILYFIFSLMFTVAIHLSFKKYMTVTTIPLAGWASLFLILVIARDVLFNFQKITVL